MTSSTKFNSSWIGSDSLLKGARVLVVEDDFLILMELEAILSEAGADIAGCRTVKDALALAERDGLAAAILDIRLGRETIAPVARELARRGIPFVFYTGQIDTSAMRAEWPDRRFVPKPSQPRAIVKAVAELLHH
jgi:DNA-binding NtrC family response regulator